MYIVANNFSGVAITQYTVDRGVLFSGHLYNNGGPNLSFEEYQSHPDVVSNYPGGVKMVSEEEFFAMLDDWQRQHYTGREPVATSEEEYNNMLECVPPLKRGSGKGHGTEWFLMGEFTTGTITAMYAEHDGRYLKKQVDAYDTTTWITEGDFS